MIRRHFSDAELNSAKTHTWKRGAVTRIWSIQQFDWGCGNIGAPFLTQMAALPIMEADRGLPRNVFPPVSFHEWRKGSTGRLAPKAVAQAKHPSYQGRGRRSAAGTVQHGDGNSVVVETRDLDVNLAPPNDSWRMGDRVSAFRNPLLLRSPSADSGLHKMQNNLQQSKISQLFSMRVRRNHHVGVCLKTHRVVWCSKGSGC